MNHIIPIFLYIIGTFASTPCPDNTWDFSSSQGSCYKAFDTAVSWTDAWTACSTLDASPVGSAQLAVIHPAIVNGEMSNGEAENEFIALTVKYAIEQTRAVEATDSYWVAGQREGWQIFDQSLFPNEQFITQGGNDYLQDSYTEYYNWINNDTTEAGWFQASKVHLSVTDIAQNQWWVFLDDAETAFYVCEKPLQTCTTDLTVARTTWASHVIGDTALSECPAGHIGNQTRVCPISAVYEWPETNECAVNVSSDGWTDTVQDGFGWDSDSSFVYPASGEGLGTWSTAASNWKMFYVGSADTYDFPYLNIQFNIYPINGFDGTVEVLVNDVNVSKMAFSSNTSYQNVIPRADWNANEDVKLTITSEMLTGSGNESFWISDLHIKPYSRAELSADCMRTVSFSDASSYPAFDATNSGFLTSDDSLTFDFSFPRELYDVEIEFRGQTVAKIGYSLENDDDTYWTADRTTVNNEMCGAERWTGVIPWTDMDGVFLSVESFKSDDTTTIGNGPTGQTADESFYVFTATLNITAKEEIKATFPGHPREWPLTRTSTWRYPFALKWERDTYVSHALSAAVCLDSHTICTVRHVTAIVSFVQTNVDPIAQLSDTATIGEVIVGITTMVAYPYMFVTGNKTDDPTNDQISLTDPDYESKWIDLGNMSSWAPPAVVAQPAEVEGKQQHVNAGMTFQFEDEVSCTHDPAVAVEYQVTKQCTQHWRMLLQPQTVGGEQSCYVNGDYTIFFSARCFYGKPVCTFGEIGGIYQNGVTSTLSITSTRMCPKLIQEVDLSGSLCSTGRARDSLGYDSECDQDSSYFQGEVTHFIANVNSGFAAIDKTEIIQIRVSQNYSTWMTADAISQNLVPAVDSSWDGPNKVLWSEGDGHNVSLLFTDDDTGITKQDDDTITIVEVRHSDDAEAGFPTTKVGFQVKLNNYIFPVPHDRHGDFTFTVVLRVTYEGFQNFTRNTGVLSNNTFGGSDDQSWCAELLSSFFEGDASRMCSEYDDAETSCPGVCSRRRLTKIMEVSTRRKLQNVPVQSGEDRLSFAHQIAINPNKAEVHGHVDSSSNDVLFTLKMTVDDEHMATFNNQRPLYYSQMEYSLGKQAGAIDGQFKCTSITRIIRNERSALEVTLNIKKLTDNPQHLAYVIAQNLEMAIQTGKIYEDAFFRKAEVYEMSYEAVQDDPDKVHFGGSGWPGQQGGSGTEEDSGAMSYSIALLCVFVALLF